MRLHFLGGANEVGASATLIEIGDRRILVDAGIRMGKKPCLPDFSVFEKVGPPEAVLLTHAHTDHTGALPILEQEKLLRSDVKTYCTPPTQDMAKVLLKDKLKQMKRDGKTKEHVIEQYDQNVKEALDRMTGVPWTKPQHICEGITARWIRAGHILGAGMIYIESPSESILMTGDVSHSRQLTIPSVCPELPSWCKPDVLVIESTYGNRTHEVVRKAEEKRLVDKIARVIEAGGKVLIPVFAIGRAQEVILILKDALERKKDPKSFPVRVDGMVQDINRIYEKYPDDLRQDLKRKVENGDDIFYSEMTTPVGKSDTRDIASWPPCCIVASSGMLNGGRSSGYASDIVFNPNNLVAISGYQAECTPGRRLLDYKVWESNDGKLPRVRCKVKQYSLSAHADRDELVGLVKQVKAPKVFLVHGDREARKGLKKSIIAKLPELEVLRPKNGKGYLIPNYPAKRVKKVYPPKSRETKLEKKGLGIAMGRRSTSERILFEIYDFLRQTGREELFRVTEIAKIWFGKKATDNPLVVQFVEWCLSIETRFFERISKDEDMFRLRPAL